MNAYKEECMKDMPFFYLWVLSQSAKLLVCDLGKKSISIFLLDKVKLSDKYSF